MVKKKSLKDILNMFLIVLLLLQSCIFFASSSKAANLTLVDAWNILITDSGYDFTSTNGASYPSNHWYNYTDFYNNYVLGSSDDAFLAYKKKSDTDFYFLFCDSIEVNNSNKILINNTSNFYTYYKNNRFSSRQYNVRNTEYWQAPYEDYEIYEQFITNKSNYNFGFIYSNGQILYSSFDYTIPTSVDFDPNGVQVAYRDYVDLPYADKVDYSVGSWLLGEMLDFGDYAKIKMVLVNNDLGNTVTEAFYFPETNVNLNNNLAFNSENKLYVKSNLINYNQCYGLTFYFYNSRNDTEFDDTATLQFNYIFLPINAVIENGSIVSAGSGDFSQQDNANTISNTINDDSEVDSILSDTFTLGSGDFEEYASEFGFTPLDNPYTTFLLHLLERCV